MTTSSDINDYLRQCGADTTRQFFDQACARGEAAANAGASNPSAESRDPRGWPILGSAASIGVVGALTELATRESEADPVAVMVSALAFGAACFGRKRFTHLGDTIHHARLFVALV